MQAEIRWLILNFPEKATREPSALEIMFDSSLPADVNFQLKVDTHQVLCECLSPFTDRNLVSLVLGTCEPNRGAHVLPSRIWKPSVHSPVRYARPREPFHGYSFLHCTPASTGS